MKAQGGVLPPLDPAFTSPKPVLCGGPRPRRVAVKSSNMTDKSSRPVFIQVF